MFQRTVGARQQAPFPSKLLLQRAIWTYALVQLIGCSVDNRSLMEQRSASGGRGSSMVVTPEGGQPGLAELPIPVCVYDGGSVEAECQSLVVNPGFTEDGKGWYVEDRQVAADWSEQNAADGEESGSLKVRNALHGKDAGLVPGGARQCVTVEPGATVQFAADLLIPEGQGLGIAGAAYTGRAGLSLLFYPSADCTIPTVGNVTSPLHETIDEWRHVSHQTVVPGQVGSMALRLIAVKDHRQYTFDVLFDNVLLKVF